MNNIVLSSAKRLSELARDNKFDTVDDATEVESSRYTDHVRWEAEKELIFAREPQLVGLTGDVPKPGDYVAFEMAGKPVFLMRGKDGVVRGFVNACRHRGAAVVSGRGSGGKLVLCPYHHWSYDTGGKLVGVPERQSFKKCDLSSRNLFQLPVEEKYGMIVMSPDPDVSADVDALLGPMASQLLPFDVSKAAFAKERTKVVNCNWKLINEASIEGYHIQPLHGASMDQMVGPGNLLRNTTYDKFGRHGRMCTGMRGLTDPAVLEDSEAISPFLTLTNFIFPTTIYEFNASGITVARHEPGPAPNRTVYSIKTYSWARVESDKEREWQEQAFDASWFFAIDEDVAVLETVQAAYDSGYPKTVIHGGAEPGVQDVNRAWDDAMGLS